MHIQAPSSTQPLEARNLPHVTLPEHRRELRKIQRFQEGLLWSAISGEQPAAPMVLPHKKPVWLGIKTRGTNGWGFKKCHLKQVMVKYSWNIWTVYITSNMGKSCLFQRSATVKRWHHRKSPRIDGFSMGEAQRGQWPYTFSGEKNMLAMAHIFLIKNRAPLFIPFVQNLPFCFMPPRREMPTFAEVMMDIDLLYLKHFKTYIKYITNVFPLLCWFSGG